MGFNQVYVESEFDMGDGYRMPSVKLSNIDGFCVEYRYARNTYSTSLVEENPITVDEFNERVNQIG